jgi:hypothetical protein
MGDLAAEGSGNHTVLEVEIHTLWKERFDMKRDWEHWERVEYGAVLGYTLGLRLGGLSRDQRTSGQAKKTN